MLNKAKQSGYLGDSETEAKNWINAVEKGLDMSQEARYKRAEEMGFGTKTVYHHGTAEFFDQFEKSKIGKNYFESEHSGFFFTKNLAQAKRYAALHSKTDNGGRVISAFLYSKKAIEMSTDSDYYAPADRFDISSFDLMHDVGIQGNDSILIKGTRNDDLMVVFEPRQILSINAAFDPETESYNVKNEITEVLDEIIKNNPPSKAPVNFNWATPENAERPHNFEDKRFVKLNVKITDIFKGMEDDFALDVNSEDGGKNAIGNRLERAKEHFISGQPMDYPEVAYSPYKKCISIGNGRHRTLAAFKLGEEFVPMFVFKEHLDKFKEMVETKPLEIDSVKKKSKRKIRNGNF